MGLSVDLNIKYKKNHTIVENGRLIDADYFSKDFDSYVLRVPKKVKHSLFYAKLNLSEEIFTHNGLNFEDVDKLFKERDPKKLHAHQL